MTVAFLCLVALTRAANRRNDGSGVMSQLQPPTPPPLQPSKVGVLPLPPLTPPAENTSGSSPPLLLSSLATLAPPPPLAAPVALLPQSHQLSHRVTNCTMSEQNIPPWLKDTLQNVPRTSAFRVAFVTLARDICHDLQINRCQIDRLLVHVPNSAVFVWEDNSADCTVDVLRRWSRDEPRVHIGSFADTTPHASSGGAEAPTRFARLAELRTDVMQRALAWGPDVVVVYDSDLAEGFAEWAILDAIDAIGNRQYAALCANDVMPSLQWRHYDSLALRFEWAKRERNYMFRARSSAFDADKVLVRSCFGGLTVYDAALFHKCGYFRADGDSAWDCEHVLLSRCIEATGRKMYVLPNMVVVQPT